MQAVSRGNDDGTERYCKENETKEREEKHIHFLYVGSSDSAIPRIFRLRKLQHDFDVFPSKRSNGYVGVRQLHEILQRNRGKNGIWVRDP